MTKWELQQRKPESVIVSAKVPIEIKTWLDQLAIETGLTVSNISAQCIIKALADLKLPDVSKGPNDA